MNDLSREIRAYALKNALEFGSADAARILPKLFNHGLQKKDIASIMPVIRDIVAEINALAPEACAKEFESLKDVVRAHEEKEKTLPALPAAERGRVVTRLPPEPSKYLHLGHALSFLINYTHAKNYQGKCLLRFEDANPEKVKQEFVDAILEDIKGYLNITPDSICFVSDDMEHFYRAAETLIEKDAAYVCFCTREVMQELRHAGRACACRVQADKETQKHWKKLRAGDYKEGEAVLRFKGDMQALNHVMRDPVLFRVVKTKHFRHKAKYKAWPLYDFYNPIEDALMGITHILRSNEFDVRVELHDALRSLLALPPLTIVQYGRFNVIGAETKGRDIRERIAAGEYTGWDDPRLVTLKTLQRRGIKLEVLRELINHIGLSKKEIHIDFAMLAALSRKLLDKEAERYYFVPEPVKLSVAAFPKETKAVDIKLHPDRSGTRRVKVSTTIYLAAKDVAQNQGQEIRLMSFCNIFLNDKPKYTGSENKRIQKVQWVSTGAVKTRIRMDTGSWVSGLGEPALKKLKVGAVVQFERFGFARLDKKTKSGLEFWFAHA
jgi:glutamyl-tRNA synthetase